MLYPSNKSPRVIIFPSIPSLLEKIRICAYIILTDFSEAFSIGNEESTEKFSNGSPKKRKKERQCRRLCSSHLDVFTVSPSR